MFIGGDALRGTLNVDLELIRAQELTLRLSQRKLSAAQMYLL